MKGKLRAVGLNEVKYLEGLRQKGSSLLSYAAQNRA
jgi:hypothetical protein